ncbi:MAG: UDP-N-acetylmuramyl-tripeptide synthetase [Mariprofundus sp.]|nr:UDP-N-acetylmuramyl-tripeptide synthetase [Mariprofundus sp.]
MINQQIRAIELSRGFSLRELAAEGLGILHDERGEDVLMMGICDDSRDARPGFALFCLPRSRARAAEYVEAASQLGATAVIAVAMDVSFGAGLELPVLHLSSMQEAGMLIRKLLASEQLDTNFYGITGTDGKTSVAWMLRNALARYQAKPVWSSGTLGWLRSPHDVVDIGNTTPSMLNMHAMLAAAKQQGVHSVVCEVSSHGIEQERIAGIDFDTAVWTNMGHDHLQDHGGYPAYLKIKASFVQQVADAGGHVVANADYDDIRHHVAAGAYWYGRGLQRDDVDLAWEQDLPGLLRLQSGQDQVLIEDIPLGDFHAENVACVALTLMISMAVPLWELPQLLGHASAPCGRMQALTASCGQVFIDYAHTAEALERCLQSARKLTRGRLMVVFGCGGERDRQKRPQMGMVAVELADLVWITSDNPRGEMPAVIASEIEQGMRQPYSAKVHLQLDRGKAIGEAVAALRDGDLLIIAGKGHENYMDICGQRLAWSDEDIAISCLQQQSRSSATSRQMRLSGDELLRATSGEWLHGKLDWLGELKTDTRHFREGDCFLALRGGQFDGHAFASSIAHKAQLLIGDTEGVALWSDLAVPQLRVADSLKALGDIAHAWRMKLTQTKVIAISGSFGKTSLRSLLQHTLMTLGVDVAATTANYNNLIGVPKTLMALPADVHVALVECGISEQGEMARLSAIVQADVAVLTGLNGTHAEGLGGLKGVMAEKAALFVHLNEPAWCVLGEGVARQLRADGLPLPADVMDVEGIALQYALDGTMMALTLGDERLEIELALPARHWAANMHLTAAIVLRLLPQFSLTDVVGALESWQPIAGRMQICKGSSGCKVLDDSYNANPASMQAAIDTLSKMSGCKIAVLGDMAELGDASALAHAELNVDGIDQLYLVGEKMRALAATSLVARWYPDHRAVAASLSHESFGPKDIILVKGSRSMALETVVELLCSKLVEEVSVAL